MQPTEPAAPQRQADPAAAKSYIPAWQADRQQETTDGNHDPGLG